MRPAKTLRRALLATALAALVPHPAPAQTPVEAPAPTQTRPNVLIFLLDDVGFAQLGCFGGLVDTPNIDRVAAQGLRYTNYHTAAVCSASRAALLTGRNPHSVHFGGHPFLARPYPGYDGHMPPDAGTLAANLHAAGYATFALGKWDHLPTPEMTPAGPFRYWPTAQGFDRFYGFLSADSDQWHPALIRDTSPVATPRTPAYHLNADLADEAIAMIRSLDTRASPAPFLLYFATGTAHAPHHAPADWIARQRGKFDQGWDRLREQILARQIKAGIVPSTTKLAPRPEGMPAWDSLGPDAKRLYTRQMEVFAASLAYADAQFGRVLDALQAAGKLENTLVIVTSDNGASAEGAPDGTYSEALFGVGHYPSVAENLPLLEKWGGPETYPHYSMGWAVTGDTPFRYYKQTTFEGGTHVPLVMAWPAGIPARGELRPQFAYVDDLAPTIMDLAHVPLAAVVNNVPQRPMEGVSLAPTLANTAVPDNHPPQYTEMYGNKGLWSGRWAILTRHRTRTWDLTIQTPPTEPWELYDLARDPGQTTDLAARQPGRVAAMAAEFAAQARRYNVEPIGNVADGLDLRLAQARAAFAARHGRWTYPGPVRHVVGTNPPIAARPFRMTVELDLPTGRETGPIFADGGLTGGMGLYLDHGVPTFIHRDLDSHATTVAASQPLRPGRTVLELMVTHAMAAPWTPLPTTVTLAANGQPLASQTVTLRFVPMGSGSTTFDIGTDLGSPLSLAYQPDTPFPGTIGKTVFDFNTR